MCKFLSLFFKKKKIHKPFSDSLGSIYRYRSDVTKPPVQPPVQQCVDLNSPPHLHSTLMMIAPTFVFHSFILFSYKVFAKNHVGLSSWSLHFTVYVFISSLSILTFLSRLWPLNQIIWILDAERDDVIALYGKLAQQ